MLRLLLSAVVGVFVTSLLLLTVADVTGPAWLLPVTGTVMTILLVLVGIGTTVAGVRTPRKQDVEAALRENRVSLARVIETRATGSSVNDQPICDIRLVVASRTRPAYTTTTRDLVNLGRLPSLQSGAVVVVAQLDAEKPDVALLDPAPPEWQAAADRDTTVRDLPEAPVWEAAPSRGRDTRGLLRVPFALLVIAFLVGAGARLWPERDLVVALTQGTSLADAVADRDQARDEAASIFPADRTQQVIDDLAEVAGGTLFTDLTIMQTYAVAEGLTEPGAQTTDRYTWRDGSASRDGAATIQPDPAELPDELFDVTEVDWTWVESLTSQFTQLTGIEDPDGPSVGVRRAPAWSVEGAPLEFTVFGGDDYHDAWITADATGTVVEMSGGKPGSTAAGWAAEHAG
ncbi:hypothetical protein [Cellulomonas triticagri]|uniref:hypothetical protein n=1 Tax=Cellulomonas triticagri TaxID=2483352 RepID=UPI0011C3BB10|nr:hypothetical protein [Cellulomonas triticagri]